MSDDGIRSPMTSKEFYNKFNRIFVALDSLPQHQIFSHPHEHPKTLSRSTYCLIENKKRWKGDVSRGWEQECIPSWRKFKRRPIKASFLPSINTSSVNNIPPLLWAPSHILDLFNTWEALKITLRPILYIEFHTTAVYKFNMLPWQIKYMSIKGWQLNPF